MNEQITMGQNRTGIQMSPLDADQMQAPPSSTPAVTPGDMSAIANMRSVCIQDAELLGTVPLPTTVTGAIGAGISILTGEQPQLLQDKLGERLAFERTGTRLYDALITKFATLHDGSGSMNSQDLLQIREEEARHFALLANAIDTMGGDPTAQTPCADLAGVQAMGLMQAITDPRTTLAQSLNAILVAELADNAGWELLIALAEQQGQDAMVSDFRVALQDEQRHLLLVRSWLEEMVLGAPLDRGAPVSSQLH